MLLEYWKNPQATTDKFVGDWLLTGVLAEGRQPTEALEQEIPEFVKTRLARHEYPRAIEFADSLPTTTTGKIMRRELRERERAKDHWRCRTQPAALPDRRPALSTSHEIVHTLPIQGSLTVCSAGHQGSFPLPDESRNRRALTNRPIGLN